MTNPYNCCHNIACFYEDCETTTGGIVFNENLLSEETYQ